MGYLKRLRKLGLATLVVGALLASVGTGVASATELDDALGMLLPGELVSAGAEGTTTLHPPIGDIECSGSGVAGTTFNTGSSTETVRVSIGDLWFNGCNATVTVLAKGSLEFHTPYALNERGELAQKSTSNNNGTLTSSGTEITVEFVGSHCIFKTNGTDIGTLTGSANTKGTATLDIEAVIPRTGGRSGAFCGTTAQWTGSYGILSPGVLNVT